MTRKYNGEGETIMDDTVQRTERAKGKTRPDKRKLYKKKLQKKIARAHAIYVSNNKNNISHKKEKEEIIFLQNFSNDLCSFFIRAQ